MKKLMLIVALGLAVVLVGAGCAKSAPPPASTTAPAPKTSPTLAGKPSPAPKPAGPAAESAAEFYKKNTVEMISPYAAGGSSDLNSRVLATFWSKATGGGNMIVKNVTGAGGITGANYIYSAKPDGLTVGTGTFGALISPVLFADPAVKFDPNKVNFLWGAFSTPWMLAPSTPNPHNTVADLQKAKGLKMGTQQRANPGALVLAFLIDVLKLDAKIVLGYAGSAETGLAAGRGEIDGTTHALLAHRTNFEKKFEKKPVVIFDRTRTDFWPDVPTLFEVVKLTPKQEQLFDLIVVIASSAQPYYTPPGVPEDRVKFLREKVGGILADKEFQKAGEKYWKVWTEPATGEEMKRMLGKALAVSKEDVASVMAIIDKYTIAK